MHFFRSFNLTAICIKLNPSATKMYCYNLAWHVYFHCCVPPADCWMQMTSSNHVIWQEITCLLQNSPVRFMLVAKYTGKILRCSPTFVHSICYQMSPPTVGNICSLLFLSYIKKMAIYNSLFWRVTWHNLIAGYRLHGKTVQLGPWKMVAIGCPETSVTICQSTPCNVP